MNVLNQNKICIFLSLQPFFFFFILLFLSLVMEAIDSWLTLFFFSLFLSLSVSLHYHVVSWVCVYQHSTWLSNTSDKKIRYKKDKAKWQKLPHTFSLFRLKVFKDRSVNLSLHNKQTWNEISTFAILTLRMSFCQTQAAQLSFFI